MESKRFCVYLDGFPKNEVTPRQIRQKIMELTGIDVKDKMPEINRTQAEWSAEVELESAEKQQEVLGKMRFFKWDPDEQDRQVEVRALPSLARASLRDP